MSDPKAEPKAEPRTITGLAASVGNNLITALPPAFLIMCVLNLAFLGLVLWFIEHQLDQRMAMANKILDHCWTTLVK
jgi:hypothetical protein